MLVSELSSLLGLEISGAFGLELFGELLHSRACKLHIFGALVKANQLWSDKACMIVITNEISISWRQTLQINDVSTLISTSDAFDFDTASNLDNFLITWVDYLVNLDVEGISHLNH